MCYDLMFVVVLINIIFYYYNCLFIAIIYSCCLLLFMHIIFTFYYLLLFIILCYSLVFFNGPKCSLLLLAITYLLPLSIQMWLSHFEACTSPAAKSSNIKPSSFLKTTSTVYK